MKHNKGKQVYNNGERNIYLSYDEAIPNGYIKGRFKVNRVVKFDWNADNTKDIIISLLKNHHGNIRSIENEIGIKSFRKGIKKHYPDIVILDYVPKLIRFQRDKNYAMELYIRCNGDIESIRSYLDSTVKSIRHTLIKHTIIENKVSGMVTDCNYDNIPIINKLREYLSEYTYTNKQSILMNRYIDFIVTCNNRNINNNTSILEKHHILPKSLYPRFKNFSHHNWNMALLTPREHFIAHLILHYFIGGSMTTAINFMLSCDRYDGIAKSKQYQKIREDYNNISNIPNGNHGFKEGERWYTNGNKNKRIKNGMPIPDGYRCGITSSGFDVKLLQKIKDTEENKDICIRLLQNSSGSISSITEYYNVPNNNAYVALRRMNINIHDYQPYSMTYHRCDDLALHIYEKCGNDLKKVSEYINVSLRSVKSRYKKIGIE